MHSLIILICLATALLAVLLFGFLLPLRRAQNLARKAQAMGFTFADSAKPFAGTNVEGFSMLENGPATVVDNVLERQRGNCRFLIFDVPLVDDSANLVTTIAAFHFPGIHLPVFQIGAKNAIDKMIERAENRLGKKVIEFSADHEFAMNFFVHCLDLGEVRTFLSPAKVAFLREYAAHFHVDSSPDWLFIYRPSYKVDRDGLQQFVEITSMIASALLSTQRFPFPATA